MAVATMLKTIHAIERLNQQLLRRTCAVATLPDGKLALMLFTARLKYVVKSK